MRQRVAFGICGASFRLLVCRSSGACSRAVLSGYCPVIDNSFRRKLSSMVSNVASDIIKGNLEQMRERPHWVRSPCDLRIFDATCTKDLLQVTEEFQLNCKQAVHWFGAVAKLQKEQADPSAVLSDRRFQLVVQQFSDPTVRHRLTAGEVFFAVRSLMYLGYDVALSPLRELHAMVASKQLLQIVPSEQLITFLCFHSDYAQLTNQTQSVQQILEDTIFRDIDKLEDPKVLMQLLSKSMLDRDRIQKVEERLLAVMDKTELALEDVVNFFSYAAKNKSRNPRLLTVACDLLCNDKRVLKLKQILKLLTAIYELRLYNRPLLFNRCGEDALIHIRQNVGLKPIMLRSFFGLLAQCRYRHTELLSQMCSWICNNMQKCHQFDFVAVVVALAKLNYCPAGEHGQQMFRDIVTKLEADLNADIIYDSQTVLDITWSLAVLNRFNRTFARRVLNPEFYRNLIDEGVPKRFSNRLKLLNIYSSLKLDSIVFAEEKWPFDLAEVYATVTRDVVSKERMEATLALLEVLAAFVPDIRCVNDCVVLEQGYFVNAIVNFNQLGEAITLSEAANEPDRITTVVYLLYHHDDYALSTQSLLGLHNMALRHLGKMGYKTVVLSVNEFNNKTPMPKKIDALKTQLTTALGCEPKMKTE